MAKHNMTKDDFAQKRILIFLQREWGINIGHPLACRLKANGAVVAGITIKENARDFIAAQQDITYDTLWHADDVKYASATLTNDPDLSLQEICDELGIDTVWPLLQAARNHIKDYSAKYYYSFRKRLSDDQLIAYIKGVFKFVRQTCEEFKPDVICLPGYIAMQHIFFYYYAKKRRIEIVSISDSKIPGVWLFPRGHNQDHGPFFDRLQELNTGHQESKNFAKAQDFITAFRRNFTVPSWATSSRFHIESFWTKRRNDFAACKKALYHGLKKYRPNHPFGITIDNRSPRIILRDHFCERAYREHVLCKRKYYPLEKVGKFVYFPLQFQPEATIDVQAPIFNNQIEVARQLAMALPGDYTLVVKEHPAMTGKRAPSYLDKIAALPNVKLVDIRIPGERLLKECSLIISPGATTVAEAAFLNKPCLQLGPLGKTAVLPNVLRYSDFTTMPQVIIKALELQTKSEDYEKKLTHYVAATLDSGLAGVDYIGIWHGKTKENLELLLDRLQQEIRHSLTITGRL